jgi:NAD(P)-dependent dehydrogenase (short-subunit alcohol dehydrogenase family)
VTGPAGNPDRFAGKVAVVVGSASGIGAATARQLAADGASVVVADVVADGAARVAAAIEDGGGRAVAVEVELRDEASVRAMVEGTLDRFGRIDALHNNAADTRPSTIGHDTDVVDIDLAIWDQTLAVDLTGYMLTCRHVIPAMLATGGGAILNTSSLAGLRGESQRVGYAVAKAGVHALTRHVALRWGKQGIRCNAMALGVVMTEALVTGITPEFRAQLVASLHVPDEGTPADIARLASFLLSDDARYVNGATIPVDGGMGVGLGG